MKRWAVLTVLLYALALLMLTLPALLIGFGAWGNKPLRLQDEIGIFQSWGYWIWLGIMIAGQALLLLLPINITERRLPARRPLKIPIIVTAFFLTNLFIAGVFSILCVAFADGAFNSADFLNPLTAFNNQDISGLGEVSGVILFIMGFWIIWAIIFRSFAKSDDPDTLLKRSTRWLLRGSILELLIAVPSHVIVRRRDDCCAPAGTFWGIATGISVMLLCFGPGVYFLFVERCRGLKPNQAGQRNTPSDS